MVYDVRHGMEKLINEYGLSQKYDVQVTLSVSECLADLSILDGMETVLSVVFTAMNETLS